MSEFRIATVKGDERQGLCELVHHVMDTSTGRTVLKFTGVVGVTDSPGGPEDPVSGVIRVELDPDGRHVVTFEADGGSKKVPLPTT